ncbi:MAG: glycosyltransferase family 2 protein [Desulfatirhabdiaceae bacterium]
MPKSVGQVPYTVAVLVPCYNEEKTIGQVVTSFKSAIPHAVVYVYDNHSMDQTSARAKTAGAVVGYEIHSGKGNVVRRMFADIEADVYVLVDGDDTYDAFSAPEMIQKLIDEKLDMVVGTRLTEHDAMAFRKGHRFGNDLLTGFMGFLFGKSFTDILSGYRVFSRRFVKSFPALSKGFETESELTIHALEMRMPTGEVITPYKSRPSESQSKLRTYQDGFRILVTILGLFKEERPLTAFTILFACLALLSMALAVPVILTYMETGLVPRFPTAILSTGIMVLAFLSLTSGIVLETVTRGRKEMKRMGYLSIPVFKGQYSEFSSQDSEEKR